MRVPMLLSVLLSMGVGTYVSLHLLGLARRTGKAPERVIGVTLLSYATVSQLAVLALEALGPEAEPAVRMALGTARVLAYLVALLGLATFTWLVFGNTRGRRALLLAIVACALPGAGLVLHGLFGQIYGDTILSPAKRIVMNLCFVTTWAWMGAEALSYHRRMRRREALGLADPAVTNRFLLWGVGSVASALLVLGLFGLALAGKGLAARNPAAELVVTLIGLVNVAVWGLTFVPPAAYLRRVRGDGAEPGSARAHG